MDIHQNLLARIAHGSEPALTELYALFSSRVYNTALSYLQNTAEAEEVTQDVFVKIYQSAGAFQGKSSVSTWIYRMAVNHSLDRISYRNRQKRFGFMVSIFGPAARTPASHSPPSKEGRQMTSVSSESCKILSILSKKKNMANLVLTALALVALWSFAPAPNQQFGTVEIKIEPEFFGQTLALGNRLYHTPKGDSLYLDLLRFYISSVQLQGTQGVFKEKDSYHLIDIEDAATLRVILKNVPLDSYQSLSFSIGTDSLTNAGGAMGGDLDPTNGMYWAWNTGYINVKIEGRSASCNTRRQAFEFHIGGYKSPHQTVRKVVLPLKDVVLRENAHATIPLHLDLGKFFSHLQLAVTNSIMIPSAEAALLADYFQEVFSSE